MATLQQAIERALAEAARARAEAETTERTLVSDPWYFLDLEHGDQRLRDYLRREQARERKAG
jgi:hypothetical protein